MVAIDVGAAVMGARVNGNPVGKTEVAGGQLLMLLSGEIFGFAGRASDSRFTVATLISSP